MSYYAIDFKHSASDWGISRKFFYASSESEAVKSLHSCVADQGGGVTEVFKVLKLS